MDYSFLFLSYNEEQHLPRLLKSIAPLNCKVYILDSGSEDNTLQIAADFGAEVKYHPFETHPKQWHYALQNFDITTPWIIGLDADQYLGQELVQLLLNFKNERIPEDVNGIYFNRHNIFKGYRLRYGGYGNKYLLKMFRNGYGYSDLNEIMDHRFNVHGKTIIWKKGILFEENLKENKIGFWISKHNKYSDLVALDEYNRFHQHQNYFKANLFGSPNERVMYFKKQWWKLPLYMRPALYFLYRFIFRLGFLEKRQGRIFHFLQAYWFRLIVDIKIEELKKAENQCVVSTESLLKEKAWISR